MTPRSASVLIATYNRAAILRETLEAMCQVNREGIDVEWIVINNSCTDDTDAVVRSFAGRLPLRLLHERQLGKNRALNKALDETKLREIVVFTDDDVSPSHDWLHRLFAACNRWPDESVFGGRILPRFKEGNQPDWVQDTWMREFAFCEHDLGNTEKCYPEGKYPYGANFWVRKRVFDKRRRYSEKIGPIGNERIMGSETSFLKELADEGTRMIYVPDVRVLHRVKEHNADLNVIVSRAVSCGRGIARIWGVDYHDFLSQRPLWWWTRQITKFFAAYVRLGLVYIYPRRPRRVRMIVDTYIDISRIEESFRIAAETHQSTGNSPEALKV